MLLPEVGDTFFCLLDLFFGHSLQSLLPVLVHMDLELVEEILGLDVRAIFLENLAILDKRLVEDGLLKGCQWRNVQITLTLLHRRCLIVILALL